MLTDAIIKIYHSTLGGTDMKKLSAIIIGGGLRGVAYSNMMNKYPECFEVVGLAEPRPERRLALKEKNNIRDDMCFEDYKQLLAKGKVADFAVIATMDQDHYAPAMQAIELGYDLLLEKPIAPTAKECADIERAAKKHGVRVVICTVLRYTPLFTKIKELITNGTLGKVMSVNHEECVGDLHQTHSYVRGNWGNVERSAIMLLAKSCHDLDLLQWLVDKKCKKIQSFGSLSYFKRENAPDGSPEYCIDGCPHADKCPYDAVKVYLNNEGKGYRGWFRTAATKLPNPTDEDIVKALKETQYGKCVFKCDNDVVDHQTVNMLFEDDITVTFTMNAFNKGGRFIHIFGTKGELRAALDGDTPISVFNFETRKDETISIYGEDGMAKGHGGGDEGIIRTLYSYLTDDYDGMSVPDIEQSTYNHMLVFAAEESRINGTVVDIDEFIARQ